MIPGPGRSHGEGNAAHSSFLALQNPMDRGAWWATVQGSQDSGMTLVTKPPQNNDWFKFGKGVSQDVYCHPDNLTSMQSTSYEIPAIKIA